MGDELLSLDEFNAIVDAEQETAHRLTAEAFAAETGLGTQEAYDLLKASLWSVTRARRVLEGKLNG
jgi:hypothetical protein